MIAKNETLSVVLEIYFSFSYIQKLLFRSHAHYLTRTDPRAHVAHLMGHDALKLLPAEHLERTRGHGD